MKDRYNMRAVISSFAALCLIALVFAVSNYAGIRAEAGVKDGELPAKEGLTTLVMGGVRDNYSRIQSGRVTYRVKIHLDNEFVAPAQWEYSLVFDGEKFKERSSFKRDDSNRVDVSEYFFDGNVSGLYSVSNKLATLWTGWSDANVSSQIGFLGFPYAYQRGVKSMYDEMVDSGAEVIGEVTVDGIRCYELEGTCAAHGRKLRWYVSPDYGFVVVKHEVELQALSPEVQSGFHEVANSDFAQFDGVWLPQKLEASTVHNRTDGSVWRRPVYTLTVESLDMNVDVSPGEVRLNVCPDTMINMDG